MLFLALRKLERLFTFKICPKVERKEKHFPKTEGVTEKRQLKSIKIKKQVTYRK